MKRKVQKRNVTALPKPAKKSSEGKSVSGKDGGKGKPITDFSFIIPGGMMGSLIQYLETKPHGEVRMMIPQLMALRPVENKALEKI